MLKEQFGDAQFNNNNYINTKEHPYTTLKETILREKFGDAQY